MSAGVEHRDRTDSFNQKKDERAGGYMESDK